MQRKGKQWKRWFHDRSSEHGLYQDDELTGKYHLYGELSWGFSDIEVTGDRLTVSYYRWLDLERFLDITEQDMKKWRMKIFDDEFRREHQLSDVQLVKRYSKTRKFSE